jgi:protein-S-isoprenylcysteine O-methyltransferase Ste14
MGHGGFRTALFNLTYRGVITHGPYRLTRHPAYVAKNLFWWSVSLPFLSPTGSMVDCIRNTAILAMVSAVYWWRAKAEERHLLAEDASTVNTGHGPKQARQ